MPGFDAALEAKRARGREYARRRRASNPEAVRDELRAWRAANSDHVKAHDAAYHQRNLEKRRASSASWRAANPERARANRRASYAANAESSRACSLAWQRANPERHADTESRRRARIAGAPAVEKIDRAAIIARDKSTCYLCGRKCGEGTDLPLHLDHVIALDDPEVRGDHTAANLAVACGPCNSRKRNRPVMAQLRLVG